MNVGEVRDIFRDGFSRVHERYEPFDDLALLHTSGGYLRQLVMMERETGRLRVQHDDVAVEIAEIRLGGDNGERNVAVADRLRSAIAYETLQGILPGHVLFIHTG